MDAATEPMNRLDIGSNHPPVTAIERAAAIEMEVGAWNVECPEITDAEMAGAAQRFVEQLRAVKKDLAAAQKTDLAPHDEAIAEVKTRYREPIGLVETAMSGLLAKSSAWLVKERARIAAEKAAQEAEARRLREEADRLQREAREAAATLASDVQEAELVANQAAEAAGAAKTAKAAERVAERKPEVAAIKVDTARRAMTLRTYWSAEVIDETAAIDSYKDHPVVRKATLAAALQVANEAARTSKDEAAAPPGFRFLKDERAS